MEITKEMLEKAIKEGKINFMIDDAAGLPVKHKEVEVRIFQEKLVIKIVVN